MKSKDIRFYDTTLGCTVKVNSEISWLIRKEKRYWVTYKSDDGGKGFSLMQANNKDVMTCQYDKLEDAKAFVIENEMF